MQNLQIENFPNNKENKNQSQWSKIDIKLPEINFSDDENIKERTKKFLNHYGNMPANQKLFRLNLWLPKELQKFDIKKEKPKSTVRTLAYDFPILWKEEDIYNKFKLYIKTNDYVTYLHNLKNSKNPIELPNLKVPLLDIKYDWMKVTINDLNDVIYKRGNDGRDTLGLSISMLGRVPEIHDILVDLLNEVLEKDEELSDEWNSFVIMAEYKGKDYKDPSRYRPLGVLPVMIRLLENIIGRKVRNIVLEKGIINMSTQKAIMSGTVGTFEHIFRLNDKIADIYQNRLDKLVVFIDVKNAYGSINYELMIHILESYGFSDKLISYLKKYFPNIKGKFRGRVFDWSNGLVQGSALSNIFFPIYIDYLVKDAFQILKSKDLLSEDYQESENIFGFVDDYAFIFERDGNEKACLEKLIDIFKRYNLKINYQKSVFYSLNDNEKELTLTDGNIKRIEKDFKYLGVPLCIYGVDELKFRTVHALNQLDKLDISNLSKKLIFYQTIYSKINRQLFTHVFNKMFEDDIEEVFEIETSFLKKWGMKDSDAEKFSDEHKAFIILNLINKIKKSPFLKDYMISKNLSVSYDKNFLDRLSFKFLDQSLLQSWKDNSYVFVMNMTYNYPNDFDQDKDVLEKELLELKKSNKHDKDLYGKKGKGFYSRIF